MSADRTYVSAVIRKQRPALVERADELTEEQAAEIEKAGREGRTAEAVAAIDRYLSQPAE